MKTSWQPSASISNLKQRALILKTIREFFAAHDVMEVETPLMCHTSVTDPFIQSIPALFQAHPTAEEQRYYLQTSPEYAMKRLLAAGSGPIYQISKAFRQGEIGHIHNPEFTMLEWYRPDFDHHQLMDEMDNLLQRILQTPPAERISYANLFQTHLQINPHHTSVDELARCANKLNIDVASNINDIDTWLMLLLSHYIEPEMGKNRPCFLYDFPISQAALAKVQPGNPPVAARFEVYYKGVELANGFYELQSAEEQRKRFEQNVSERKIQQLTDMPIDEYLLAALTHGLPNCSGVALGIDRLIMLAGQHDCIQNVISFDFSRI